MDYITTKELAEKWGVSVRTANLYLNEGRVEGAVRKSGGWLAPADAPKPGRRPVKAFMPIWKPYASGESQRMIDGLPDGEERCAARAAQYYFQARYDEACAEAGRCMQSTCPEIRATALLVHSMASVPFGEPEVTRRDFYAIMQEAARPADARMASIYEYIRFLMGVFFHHDDNNEPECPNRFDGLSEGARLYALYAYAHALYLRRDYARALGVAESALTVAAGRYPSVCIYLDLVASMAATNLARVDLADRFFLDAWRLAEPEGYIQPVAEHHGMLQGQVEKYFRGRAPELYERIADRVVRFSRGWMKIHNPQSVNKVTDRLTPFEFALAMMAVKGKSNREIADYLSISVNTVKAYLSSIYQKVGVGGRGELEQYLNR